MPYVCLYHPCPWNSPPILSPALAARQALWQAPDLMEGQRPRSNRHFHSRERSRIPVPREQMTQKGPLGRGSLRSQQFLGVASLGVPLWGILGHCEQPGPTETMPTTGRYLTSMSSLPFPVLSPSPRWHRSADKVIMTSTVSFHSQFSIPIAHNSPAVFGM